MIVEATREVGLVNKEGIKLMRLIYAQLKGGLESEKGSDGKSYCLHNAGETLALSQALRNVKEITLPEKALWAETGKGEKRVSA